ncbi:MAG TPA: hypothetical protein DD979_17085 [Gammaproteobacteria bacterium]|jgi:predicted enzyme related to lactoylglutathione lyase|nr:hypothetical protein [Gammaproteobacteria bacterium]
MVKNAVNWFEIPVSDLDRATDFYQHMMHTELERSNAMDGMDLAIFPYDEQSVSGALVKAEFLTPASSGSVVYLNAEGILDDAISRAQEKGASIAIPKTAIGEHGFFAHIIDCEGNRVGLHSMAG